MCSPFYSSTFGQNQFILPTAANEDRRQQKSLVSYLAAAKAAAKSDLPSKAQKDTHTHCATTLADSQTLEYLY